MKSESEDESNTAGHWVGDLSIASQETTVSDPFLLSKTDLHKVDLHKDQFYRGKAKS